MKTTNKNDDALVAEILLQMGFEAPKPRGRNCLDFRDIHVTTAETAIRKAIAAARRRR